MEVNEEGTEAAAVTGAVMMTRSLPPQPVKMKVRSRPANRDAFWRRGTCPLVTWHGTSQWFCRTCVISHTSECTVLPILTHPARDFKSCTVLRYCSGNSTMSALARSMACTLYTHVAHAAH
eukprot:9490534-Pyramimonas_sp.AAC.1